jgi:hypothetical protein
MPGQNIQTSSSVLYTGTPLTAEEEQEAAEVTAQALADYVSGKGKTVVSVNGGVLEGGTPNQ